MTIPEIPKPQLPWNHSDRLLHCEEMIEPAFLDLAARAEAAGWNADEVALALQSLGANYVLSRAANAETDSRALAARKSREH